MIGKSFYEQLRALQKEIDSERRKSQELSNVGLQQTQVDAELTEAQLRELREEITNLKLNLEQKSAESHQNSMQLQAVQVSFLTLTGSDLCPNHLRMKKLPSHHFLRL
jgi:seryl-tRNA synthetase